MQPVNYFVIACVTVHVSIVQANMQTPCLADFRLEMTVNTTTGMLKGKTVCLSQTEKIVAFFGVPYAEPPIKDLRFMPPVKKSRWKDTMEAFQFGKVCLHPPWHRMRVVCEDREWTSLPYGDFDESEDCLTLNIFTPSLTGAYPVMFFVHGGTLQMGAGGLHPAEKLSHSGAVVVTFNYRLGIMGFLSTGNSAAPGNYGLMDQIMALEWVNENIHQFGGNPSNITMVGQSAGASAVHLHLLSNRTKDLFSTAIIQSGVAISPWAIERTPVVWARQLSELLNCPVSPSVDMILCLRSKNESDLLRYAYREWENTFDPPWSPVVDHDLLSDEPENLMRKGQIQKKPVVIGLTDDEASGFTYYVMTSATERARERTLFYEALATAGNETFNLIKDRRDKKTLFVHMLEAMRINDSRAVQAALKSCYFDSPVEKSADTVWARYAQMVSDGVFNADTVKALNYHSQHTVPTYFYVFDYRDQNDSLPLWTGVYHGVDMRYIFGCLFASDTETVQGTDKIMSELMMKLWINFAQFGNPINPDDITRNIEWSPYGDSDGQYYLNISDVNPRRQQHYRRKQMTFWNTYMPTVGTFGAERPVVNCATHITNT